MTLESHQQYFCSRRCRTEYRRRGYKPRIERNRTRPCQHCGQPLSGKQRKWCSDKCRKRAARAQKKASALKAQASANVRKSKKRYGNLEGYKGMRRVSRLTVIIKTVQVERHLDHYDPMFHLRLNALLRQYSEALEAIMQREVYGHSVTVNIYLG